MHRNRIMAVIITALLLLDLGGCSPKLQQPEAREEAGKVQTNQTETVQASNDTQTTSGQTDAETTSAGEEEASSETGNMPAIDFTLTDQYGNTHTLSDYKGRVVFLNFWATWCPPCRAEMPDIQKLYREYEEAGDDSVVILGVAAPGLGGEKNIAGITDFLNENGYTYPVVMDETGELFAQYYITAYPTTYMIDKAGNVFGYLTGSMPESTMRSIIEQTVTGVRKTP